MTAPAADVSVRPAQVADTAAVAAVQVETWQACYAPRLPPGALDALEETAVEAGWRAAVSAPPSPAHRLLVATAAGRVSGYVAVGPAEDGDATQMDGEILRAHRRPRRPAARPREPARRGGGAAAQR